MFLQRQISASLVEGDQETLANGYKFPYKLVDVLPKYVLALGEGEVTSGYLELEATDSTVLQLPAAYVSPARISCVIRASNITKVVVVSPTHGTSTYLIKSTNTEAEGEHFGLLMWQGDITSITVSVPATFEDSLVEYFMFVIPDLDSPDSYLIGDRAIGYVTQ
jgi:hypothetical protein